MKSSLIMKCPSFIKVLGEDLPSDIEITTDTRDVEGKNTFIALYGPQFDGHKFVSKAPSLNLTCLIIEEERVKKEETPAGVSIIFVSSTFKFIQELANLRSRQWQDAGGVLFAITGSNGKTSNKEILKTLFDKAFEDQVIATKGNLNNHIGVPLTIFSIKDDHRIAIIEMGTNHPGEIELLCEIANPLHGFITNIGAAHLEFLNDLKGVAKEKLSLFKQIKKRGGLFVANIDDPYLLETSAYEKTISFSKSEASYIYKRRGREVEVKSKDQGSFIFENFEIEVDFQAINLLQCFFLCFSVFPEKKDIFLNALSTYSFSQKNRGEWIQLNQKEIFLDSYNANPSSMQASIELFISSLKSRGQDLENSMPILGDMNELGEKEDFYHESIGSLLKESGLKEAIFIGRMGESYKKGFAGKSHLFKDMNELKEKGVFLLKEASFLFVKGSRSLQMEQILDINI